MFSLRSSRWRSCWRWIFFSQAEKLLPSSSRHSVCQRFCLCPLGVCRWPYMELSCTRAPSVETPSTCWICWSSASRSPPSFYSGSTSERTHTTNLFSVFLTVLFLDLLRLCLKSPINKCWLVLFKFHPLNCFYCCRQFECDFSGEDPSGASSAQASASHQQSQGTEGKMLLYHWSVRAYMWNMHVHMKLHCCFSCVLSSFCPVCAGFLLPKAELCCLMFVHRMWCSVCLWPSALSATSWLSPHCCSSCLPVLASSCSRYITVLQTSHTLTSVFE